MPAPADLFDADAFRLAIPSGRALLGLDPGTKTIGVAISDVNLSMASPLLTIRRTKFANDVEALRTIIAREHIGGLVMGMPYNMDGSAGPRAQSVRAFRRALGEQLTLPMLFWDERLSSAAAADSLKAAGRSSRQREASIDAAAAAHILSDCLAHLATLTNQ